MKKVLILGMIIGIVLTISVLFVFQKQAKYNANLINTTKEDSMEEIELFGAYYEKANQKLQTLTIEEKIAQLFIIGTFETSDQEELKKYQFGGYLFFSDFFAGKTEAQIKQAINQFQEYSKIPLLIAVDEEGGRVVRVSSNTNLRKEPFQSPSQLYQNGGFERIKEDTIQKSEFLAKLGINLNFAPVVDITRNTNDYMYERSLQQGKELTTKYAKTVINASKQGKVSYTLKHFPGYGNNKDTHTGRSVDERSYEEIVQNDLEPFRIGIEQKAEAIMISHNIVTGMDETLPASLSPFIHRLLRKELNFQGIIITDDIKMGAIGKKYSMEEAIVKAILAGNDMIILSIDKNTKDKITNEKVSYQNIINYVKNALNSGRIKEKTIHQSVRRILAWKYYKGLM